jgi:hypothetical protein
MVNFFGIELPVPDLQCGGTLALYVKARPTGKACTK